MFKVRFVEIQIVVYGGFWSVFEEGMVYVFGYIFWGYWVDGGVVFFIVRFGKSLGKLVLNIERGEVGVVFQLRKDVRIENC